MTLTRGLIRAHCMHYGEWQMCPIRRPGDNWGINQITGIIVEICVIIALKDLSVMSVSRLHFAWLIDPSLMWSDDVLFAKSQTMITTLRKSYHTLLQQSGNSDD